MIQQCLLLDCIVYFKNEIGSRWVGLWKANLLQNAESAMKTRCLLNFTTWWNSVLLADNNLSMRHSNIIQSTYRDELNKAQKYSSIALVPEWTSNQERWHRSQIILMSIVFHCSCFFLCWCNRFNICFIWSRLRYLIRTEMRETCSGKLCKHNIETLMVDATSGSKDMNDMRSQGVAVVDSYDLSPYISVWLEQCKNSSLCFDSVGLK